MPLLWNVVTVKKIVATDLLCLYMWTHAHIYTHIHDITALIIILVMSNLADLNFSPTNPESSGISLWTIPQPHPTPTTPHTITLHMHVRLLCMSGPQDVHTALWHTCLVVCTASSILWPLQPPVSCGLHSFQYLVTCKLQYLVACTASSILWSETV